MVQSQNHVQEIQIGSVGRETLVNEIRRLNPTHFELAAPSGSSLPGLGSSTIQSVSLAPADGSAVWLSKGEYSRVAEQYRIVRTRLIRSDKKLDVLLVASPGPGDGKTISAINLAGICALKGDQRVLLIDGDMRRPHVARRLAIDGQVGFSDVLEGRCEFNEAVIQVAQQPNLHILPAGCMRSNPAELLSSNAWRHLATLLRANYRWIIIDSPPVASVADYELLELSADGIVMIVRPDHTKRKAFIDALKIVNQDKLLGTILNGTQDWFGWKTFDYYYYGS